VADDAGADAIMDLAGQVSSDYFASAEILYVDTRQGNAAERLARLRGLNCPRFYVGPSIAAAMPRLSVSLQRARMGPQLYFAGSETLLGMATMVAMQAGFDHQALQTEHRGSLARRVQCVHCKGFTENVTTQPAHCSHCGLLLLVRDHYSRRLAAFQGVNINAEDPSVVPAAEEVFR
jgi:hypothetical protein